MWLILIGFTLIILIDLIPIIRKRSARNTLVFLLLFIPALILAMLQAYKIEVPSIMLLIGDFLKMLGVSYSS